MEIKSKTEKKIYIVLSAVIALSLLFCAAADYYFKCAEVRNGVLRLHIIANSDSQRDQEVKLAVRDELLNGSADIFTGDIAPEEAASRLAPYLGSMKEAADATLKENGFSYTSSAQIVYEYFPTRVYDGFTLPAGRYTALKIVLGEGEGKNWWCVMFPPLCLPAAGENGVDIYSVFSGDGIKVVSPDKGYRVRFKIVEIVEEMIEWMRRDRGSVIMRDP